MIRRPETTMTTPFDRVFCDTAGLTRVRSPVLTSQD